MPWGLSSASAHSQCMPPAMTQRLSHVSLGGHNLLHLACILQCSPRLVKVLISRAAIQAEIASATVALLVPSYLTQAIRQVRELPPREFINMCVSLQTTMRSSHGSPVGCDSLGVAERHVRLLGCQGHNNLGQRREGTVDVSCLFEPLPS
jgi:hypothetical protein